jgi:hypothetical protein
MLLPRTRSFEGIFEPTNVVVTSNGSSLHTLPSPHGPLAVIGDESKASALTQTREHAMQTRRRFKQTESFEQRLETFARDARGRADLMPEGEERDDLIKRARRTDTAAHIDQWANSAGLQSPK